ncbi:DNA translocase FtsK 4TM domain-containing protein, partial [Patescibacteria group bacterium]|nr:DNA translocase FtsK 4TM domain-containing protein [Patescibacteria group bacterium]
MVARRLTPAKRARRLKKKDFKIELESHIAREVGAVIYLGLAAIFFLVISGKAGILGNWANTYLRLIFGIGTLVLPVLFLALAVTLFVSRRIRLDTTRYLGIVLLLFSSLGLIHMRTPMDAMLDNVEQFGGYFGFLASVLLRIFISDTGAKVVLIVVLLVAILITFEISIRSLIALVIPNRQIKIGTKTDIPKRSGLLKKGEDELNIVKPLLNDKREEKPISNGRQAESFNINKPEPVSKRDTQIRIDETDYSDWEFPPLDLLSSQSSEVYVSDKVLKENAEKIKEKLAQFDIEVGMRDVNIGPTVLQYTLQPSEGIKLNKITALKNDLALALAAKSIRIEAPIPGKSLVGIEVPNEKRMVVHLRELIESEEFESTKSKLRLVIGRDVSGAPVIDDLTSMPHLLIAGSTGSGKSVGMNAFLLSLLYQNSPQDLKFIMIDPKRVELTTYNGIPHLLTPVITEPDKAHSSLKWAVAEMNRRYKELADKKYRN